MNKWFYWGAFVLLAEVALSFKLEASYLVPALSSSLLVVFSLVAYFLNKRGRFFCLSVMDKDELSEVSKRVILSKNQIKGDK